MDIQWVFIKYNYISQNVWFTMYVYLPYFTYKCCYLLLLLLRSTPALAIPKCYIYLKKTQDSTNQATIPPTSSSSSSLFSVHPRFINSASHKPRALCVLTFRGSDSFARMDASTTVLLTPSSVSRDKHTYAATTE